MSKNTRNRILLTALAALLLVTLTIGGTMAWLTANTDPLTNTFTHSAIDVSIAETEKDFQMIPGDTIDKDPVVTVDLTDVESAWVFVKVEESTTPKLADYIDYDMASAWTALTGYTGVYYTSVELAEGAADKTVDIQVLANDQVTVLGTVTTAMMKAIDGEDAAKPTLAFTAYAVQKSVSTDPVVAWKTIGNGGVTPAE